MNRYPRGKLNDDDDGELMIAITEQDNTVIISFGKMVSWIGMSRPEAIEFAKVIMMRAGGNKDLMVRGEELHSQSRKV